MRRLTLCALLLLTVLPARLLAASARPPAPAAAGATRYTRLPDYLHDPQPQPQQSRRASSHERAAAAAREYALQYVRSMHQRQEQHDTSDDSSAPPQHLTSAYERLSRRAAAEASDTRASAPLQPAFDWADESDSAFVEESVHVHSRAPYASQAWTYADSAAPPKWLQMDPNAKQGVPTTKPPPVPRMPPPPPTLASPDWMSPFVADSANAEQFSHDDTPSPFFGMGPVPAGPPRNYLPLDTFMSPAPDG